MKSFLIGFSVIVLSLLTSCRGSISVNAKEDAPPLQGSWKLFSATLIENGDTTNTDYSQKLSFIKIINDSHFAFIQHDLNNGKDSTASFASGAGRYELKDSTYIEHLEYCNDRQWEGHDFTFKVTISNDTLIQRGMEIIENANINRENIERYVRIKSNGNKLVFINTAAYCALVQECDARMYNRDSYAGPPKKIYCTYIVLEHTHK